MHLGLSILLLSLAITHGFSSYQNISEDYYPCSTGNGQCIIGGREAKKNAYPFMVRLIVSFETGEKALCGGTLITTHWVMTAAHCVYVMERRLFASNITIHMGDHHFHFHDPMEQILEAQRFKIHPNYIEKEDNDIALVKLQTKPNLTRAVQIGCLSPKGHDYIGKTARAIGWGLTSLEGKTVSPVLKETDVPILPGQKCFLTDLESKQKICTGFIRRLGDDTVFMGDSGGPLFVTRNRGEKPTIIGVASLVAVFPFIKPTILFAVFTRVSYHLNWIITQTDVNELCINDE